MTASNQKPQLSPESVEWMVDPATPQLELRAQEVAGPWLVRLLADFGPLSPESARLRWLELSFVGSQASRLTGAWSNSEVVPPDRYEWQRVPFQTGPIEDVNAWLAQRRSAWIEAQLCPDPRIYEALGSSWAHEIGITNDEGLHHYLILGHDAYVEILAESWSWKVVDIDPALSVDAGGGVVVVKRRVVPGH